MQKLMLILGLCVFAVGCKKVEIQDGIVPDAYLSEAKKLEGYYQGSFNGLKTDIEIVFNGNKPMIVVHNTAGNDLLDQKCVSTIGDLKWVKANDDMKITDVGFAFDPANCVGVQGREFIMHPKTKNGKTKIESEIFSHTEYVDDPHCRPGTPPHGDPMCRKVPQGFWFTGSFVK